MRPETRVMLPLDFEIYDKLKCDDVISMRIGENVLFHRGDTNSWRY